MDSIMKKFFVLSCCILAAIAARATQLEISHLTGNFYVFTTWKMFDGSPFPANGMYVVTPQGVVMIDMPWDDTQARPLLDSIEKKHHAKVIMSISTHFHADRTGSIDILKAEGVKTYSTAYTLELCRKHKEQEAAYIMAPDTAFIVGGLRFETYYPGKGHAPDNIVVWFPDAKVLYGGCFVKSTESKGLGNLGDADVKAWEKSVKNVMKRYPQPAYVIPGHQGWSDAGALKYTLKLIKEN